MSLHPSSVLLSIISATSSGVTHRKRWKTSEQRRHIAEETAPFHYTYISPSSSPILSPLSHDRRYLTHRCVLATAAVILVSQTMGKPQHCRCYLQTSQTLQSSLLFSNVGNRSSSSTLSLSSSNVASTATSNLASHCRTVASIVASHHLIDSSHYCYRRRGCCHRRCCCHHCCSSGGPEDRSFCSFELWGDVTVHGTRST